MSARRLVRQGRRDEGATSVEFALVVPVFLVLIGGILALGLRMVYSGVAEHAAREGLRTALLKDSNGQYANEAGVKGTVDDVLNGLLTPTSVKLAVTGPGTTKRQGDEVTVTVKYRIGAVQAAANLIPFGLGRSQLERLANVETSAEGRLE